VLPAAHVSADTVEVRDYVGALSEAFFVGVKAAPVQLAPAVAASADRILDAQATDTVDDLLELELADDRFWIGAQESNAQASVGRRPSEHLAETIRQAEEQGLTVTPDFRAMLGSGLVDKVEEGNRNALAIMRFAQGLMASAEEAYPQPVPPNASALGSVIYNENVPLVVRRVLLKFYRSLLSAMVLQRATTRGREVDKTRVMQLVDIYASGMQTTREAIDELHARMVGGAVLFAPIVADHAKWAEHQRRVHEWADKAEAAGTDVYYPFGGPDARR
jgi:hypothetical protein